MSPQSARDAGRALLQQDRAGDWRGEPGEHRVVHLGRTATVADLRRVRGKGEIVDGALVLIGPSGCLPASAARQIRDERDYGRAAEEHAAGKRADYFATGTMVVWDVDVLREQGIRAYRSSEPETPVIYRRGETAEAEPAVPGWRVPVDDLWL